MARPEILDRPAVEILIDDGGADVGRARHGRRLPEALADAILRLLNTPSERVRLAIEARRLIEGEFDAHLNAARLRALWPIGK